MKKFIFAAAAMLALTACNSNEGKCTDVKELQEAIVTGSTDTLKYDLNGDGEVTIADINVLVNDSTATDSTAVDTI